MLIESPKSRRSPVARLEEGYSHFLLFSPRAGRKSAARTMAMIRRTARILDPGAARHQGEPQDMTDMFLHLNATS
ncbi:hypothetical protein KM043_014205 [Ampulex compressa]|nr:hypothetical protein KM043_014205 [Ampulex compressa]